MKTSGPTTIVRRLSACAAIVLMASGCDLLGPGPHRWEVLDASDIWTCGLTADDRSVYCWGVSPGFTDAVDVLHPDSLLSIGERPSRVPGASNLVSISNQAGTLCAIGADRTAYCAGLNTLGQVGDGTGNLVARGSLTKVVGDHRWKVVHGTRDHSCGVTLAGEAYCWGMNSSGKLGNDTIPSDVVVPFPVPVVGGHVFETLGVGLWFTCALTASGESWCWGIHAGLYLGVGDALAEASSAVPVRVAGGHSFVSLTVGSRHACGVTNSGDAYCWGDNSGRLGDGSMSNRGTPTRVVGGQKWQKLFAGFGFTCGLTTNYAVYCWGDASRGPIIPGSSEISVTPQLIVSSVGPYRDLAAGGDYVCGVRWDRQAECWGKGDWGQLGDGRRESSAAPVRVVR